MKKKTVALLLALVLCAGCAVGGTVAWLTAESATVTNTFTPSNITITLTESKPNGNTAKMVPGDTIAKDPKVTVAAGSEPCWLFIKVEDNGAAAYLDYSVKTADSYWTAVPDKSGYYYCKVDALDAAVEKSILTGDAVTVKNGVTSANMKSLIDSGNNPTLTFKAAAVQQANIADDVTAAWAALPSAFTGANS